MNHGLNFEADHGHSGGSCGTTGKGFPAEHVSAERAAAEHGAAKQKTVSLPTAKSGGGCASGGCSTHKGEPKDAAPSFVQLNVGLVKAERSRPAVEDLPFAGTPEFPQGLLVGLDVGSTTVKYVVVNPLTDEILAKDYQRHDTKQPEKCVEMFTTIAGQFPGVPRNSFRVFMTGSGGTSIGKRIGAKFVQEVNAVSLSVEKLYPDVQSVVELGGQDAKIIVFKPDEQTGKKKKIPSMNDKCAGGTGAVIDKINAKLKIPAAELCNMGYLGLRLHPVAGKCGVFAETDINGLQKQGVPPDQLMASLFESIIQQNLAVLTRGHTLRPQVLLLGGPNCYIKGMRDCWRHNIPQIWKERKVQYDESKPIEELVVVPDNAQYFAALGAVEYAKIELADNPNFGVFRGLDELRWYLDVGRIEEKKAAGAAGLVKSTDELEAFRDRYRKKSWSPATFRRDSVVRAFVGLDGGSTSTKGVLLDENKQVVGKSYQLSKGNPIEDTMDIFAALEKQVAEQGARLEVLGVGTTGYAKDILKDVLQADVALVETVAHTQAGLHFYPDTDVIVDVGGQDIKLIILKNGQVKDFKLNTQCSAGNGYFLQSTAQGFGFKVEEFADIAFSAAAMPQFGYGCAVFMQSDIVDFQRQGWSPNEIMAGLCDVLPKNIWLYVSQIPNLAKLGRTFVLQGGTQHNLAAVKSQVDFIESRFRGAAERPNVIVHQHCGEAGAIGCAVEAHRLFFEEDRRTQFIGLDRVRSIQFRTTREEATRCYFCKNKCLRTFIDVKSGEPAAGSVQPSAFGLPLSAASHQPSAGASQDHGKRIELTTHIIKTGPEAGHPTRIKHGPSIAEHAPSNGEHGPLARANLSLPVLSETRTTATEPVALSETEAPATAPVGSVVLTAPAADAATDSKPAPARPAAPSKSKSKVPLQVGEQRLIIATCEKGTVEDVSDMREIKKGLDEVKKANPNFAEIAAREAFRPTGVKCVADPIPADANGKSNRWWLPSQLWHRLPAGDSHGLEARAAARSRRGEIRIGMPRALNMYSMAPWFMAYFESLGIASRNLIWSDYTSEELYKTGAKRGAIDPCFPSKIGIPHVHNLIYDKHAESPLNYIFFPMIDSLPTFMHGVEASKSCPTVATTPEAVKAAFTKESDLFAEHGLQYLDTFVSFAEPALLARQMFNEFADKLGLTHEENARACKAAWEHYDGFWADLRDQARKVLEQLEREDRIGVVLLTRPYHHDPGVCHEIPDELQKVGFPVFTMDCLPRDPDILERLFGAEVRAGAFASPLSIEDAWKNAYSENTNRKVWAAKYAARHPNLVALELSSFKCGHDAPIYSVIEEIIETSGTPYFCFKDIDENKPTGSIRIRVETIVYFLKRHRLKLVQRRRKLADIDQRLAEFESRLRGGSGSIAPSPLKGEGWGEGDGAGDADPAEGGRATRSADAARSFDDDSSAENPFSAHSPAGIPSRGAVETAAVCGV